MFNYFLYDFDLNFIIPNEFIVQLIALVLGLIMGVLQMKDTENYWTDEYLQYAKDYVVNATPAHVTKTCQEKQISVARVMSVW